MELNMAEIHKGCYSAGALLLCGVIVHVLCSQPVSAIDPILARSNGQGEYYTMTAAELLSFMEYHLYYCRGYTFCTLQSRNTTLIARKRTHVNVCPPCSCENDCLHQGLCCPDHKLSKLLMGAVYTNVTEYLYVLSEQDLTDAQVVAGVDKVIRRPYEECVPETFLSREGAIFRKKDTISYLMIMSCPANTTAALNDRCQRNVEKTSDIRNWLPIVSNKTDIVYKNSYCLICHEGLGVPNHTFTIVMVDKRSTINIPSFISPSEVLAWWVNIPNSYIVVSPRVGYTPPYLRICSTMNANTCPKTFNDSYNYPLNTWCNSVDLPFYYSIDGTTVASFKNVACFECNIGRWSMTEVKENFNVVSSPFKCAIELNSHAEPGYALSFLNSFFLRKTELCTTGWVYVEKKKSCIQLVCPRHMYMKNDVCLPIYGRLENIYFRAIISITFGQWKQPMKLNLTVYLQQLTSAIEQSAHGIFKTCTYGIWSHKHVKKPAFVVLLLFVLQDNHTYVQHLFALNKMVAKLTLKNVAVGDSEIPLTATITDRYESGMHALKDRLTGKGSTSFSYIKRINHAYFDSLSAFDVSTSMYCPRVGLDPFKDVIMMTKQKIKVNDTDRFVFGRAFDFSKRLMKILVCADRYIPDFGLYISVEHEIHGKLGNSQVVKDMDDPVPLEVKIAIPASIAFVVLSVLLGNTIRKVYTRRQRKKPD